MNTTIKDAIESLRLLRVRVHDQWYTIEPYSYGKVWTGQEALRAFVVDREPGGKIPTDWYLFLLSDISEITPLRATFDGRRTDFEVYDLAMFFIYCRVEHPYPPVHPAPGTARKDSGPASGIGTFA